jgi:hypothetical protein
MNHFRIDSGLVRIQKIENPKNQISNGGGYMNRLRIFTIALSAMLTACVSTTPTLTGEKADKEARELAAATAQVFGVDVSAVIVSNISKRKTMGGYMLTTTYFNAKVAGVQYRCKVEGVMFEVMELEPHCMESKATDEMPASNASSNSISNGTAISSSTNSQIAGNPDVKEAQSILNGLGLDAGPADGLMGPRTEKAISNFQKISDLEATGQLDEVTLEELRSVQTKDK